MNAPQTRDYDRMKLAELATAIRDHLRRLEAEDKKRREGDPSARSRYYHAGASARGNKVMVTYVTYQGSQGLSKAEAVEYLRWLDAGTDGSHYEQQRQQRAEA